VSFWFDQTRNLLIYPSAYSANLQAAIPEARTVNGHYLAVPRTLRNCQVLRHFNYPVVPIIDGYDWPAPPGMHPYESQKLTANFLVTHPRSFNLSDMGTGKTNAVLWAADWLMRKYPKGTCRALIVAPLSILQRVWGDAIFRNFLGNRSYQILHGTAEQRLSALARDADFYIVNFDGVGTGAHTKKRLELAGFSRALADRTDIRIAIVDEASAYKDSTTKRHRIARLVFGQKEYLWCLSGTPTANGPVDAFGIAKLVNNAFGRSFTNFRLDTMYQPFPGSFKWIPKKDGYDKARKLLSPSIRFDIKDVWDGPEITTQQREVPLTDQQKKLMADLKRDFVVKVKSGESISMPNEAAARQKFIQISLGAIYDNDHDIHLLDAKPRLEEMKAVIREAPGKLLIFAPLTSVVNLLYKELDVWSREIVNGNTSSKDRARIFQDFQQSADPRLLIADPGTMAHGLDLFMAQTVVWYGATDKTELYLQANKRAHRPGQKHPVTVVQIVSNALEREIYRRLETNTTMQGALLDIVRKGEL
jgi:SNF2 family DNA or RNA helicase